MSDSGENETVVGEADDLATEIVELAAATTGTAVTDLPVLFGAIDVEALDELWRRAEGSLTVRFAYARCDLRLSDDGRLVAAEIDD